MEQFWYGRLRALPNQEMEKRFLETFPYYLGLTENAIQYLVDTEIDDLPRSVDAATICHHRFGQKTWGKTTFTSSRQTGFSITLAEILLNI
ncbi:hypothetical protein MUB15_20735 [Priestia sp. OVS21]|nr:hypothetical protein [Priestia sp. OVS21]